MGDERVRAVLHEGRQAYLALETEAGPHVTPALYGIVGEDLVAFSAVTTAKAKAARRQVPGSMLVRAGDRSVVVSGTFEAADPMSVRDVVGPRRAVKWARATGSFALRNAPDLVAFARDAVLGRAGRFPPPRRLLLTLKPARVALLEKGRLVLADGNWPGPAEVGTEGLADAGAALDRSLDAVLAIASDIGPVALPASWDSTDRRALVSAGLLRLVGAASVAPAAVVVDEYVAPGPAAKRGTLSVGEATVENADDSGVATVTLRPQQTSAWDGTDTTTVRSGPSADQ